MNISVFWQDQFNPGFPSTKLPDSVQCTFESPKITITDPFICSVHSGTWTQSCFHWSHQPMIKTLYWLNVYLGCLCEYITAAIEVNGCILFLKRPNSIFLITYVVDNAQCSFIRSIWGDRVSVRVVISVFSLKWHCQHVHIRCLLLMWTWVLISKSKYEYIIIL